LSNAVLWQYVFQVVVCVLGALPDLEDGPSGLKRVGANIRHFNVNFNIL